MSYLRTLINIRVRSFRTWVLPDNRIIKISLIYLHDDFKAVRLKRQKNYNYAASKYRVCWNVSREHNIANLIHKSEVIFMLKSSKPHEPKYLHFIMFILRHYWQIEYPQLAVFTFHISLLKRNYDKKMCLQTIK